MNVLKFEQKYSLNMLGKITPAFVLDVRKACYVHLRDASVFFCSRKSRRDGTKRRWITS